MRPDPSAILAGLGNTGAEAVPLLARLPELESLTVIDPEDYEEKNLRSQAIRPRDVGRSKALTQARRAKQIRPDLEVKAIRARAEHVPLGRLRAGVILSALDSLGVRRLLARAAWRLGVPFVDIGVQTEELLARMSVHIPGESSPCLECGWDDRHYEAVERLWACDPGEEVAPTNGITALGALPASLMALEVRAILSGEDSAADSGREIVVVPRHGRARTTRVARRPDCRFDHRVWNITPWSAPLEQSTLGDLFRSGGSSGPRSVRVEGAAFVSRLVCTRPDCGGRRRLLRLEGRIPPRVRACPRCGGEMVPLGFHRFASLRPGDVPSHLLNRSLASIGARPGDVVTVRSGDRTSRFELFRSATRKEGADGPGLHSMAS